MLGQVPSDADFNCKGCKLGKQIQLPYPLSTTRSSRPFDLIHSDVWGPSPFVSKGGHKYYVIFIDDHSRYTWTYFMKHRSQLISIYKAFASMIHTQFQSSIRIFRADSGGNIYPMSFISFFLMRVLSMRELSLSFHFLALMLKMGLLSASTVILLRQLALS